VDDAAAAGELAAIAARLQALAAGPPSPHLGEELGKIRAELRRLASENDEVGRRLAEQLGLQPPPDPVALQ
jgi:hypothetical protein